MAVAEFTASYTALFRRTVKETINDPDVQSDIWYGPPYFEATYVIRLGFGAIIESDSATEAINQARDLWRAHQRLTGEHNEGVRMGSTQ